MFEFIQRFFGKPSSSATAKERLRLVLLSDHLSLAPDVVEALKHDLIAVISRYCDVDAAHCDVTFEQQEKQVAMLANIPILGMRGRPKPLPPAPPPPPPGTFEGAGATASVAVAPATGAPAATPVPAGGSSRRRKRRRAGAGGTNGAAAPKVVPGAAGLPAT